MTYDKDSLWVSFQDDICATMKAAKDFGFIEGDFNEIPASVLGELYPEAKDFGLTAFIVAFADDEAKRLFKFASTLNPENVAKTYLHETSGTGLVQEMEHLLKVRMQSIYNSLSSETITVVPGVEYAHDSVIDPANHETWAHSCKLLVELMANVY